MDHGNYQAKESGTLGGGVKIAHEKRKKICGFFFNQIIIWSEGCWVWCLSKRDKFKWFMVVTLFEIIFTSNQWQEKTVQCGTRNDVQRAFGILESHKRMIPHKGNTYMYSCITHYDTESRGWNCMFGSWYWFPHRCRNKWRYDP